ncbi:helix-turn-helix domain-containing protein [Flavobacterium sp. J372]|uniref:TetR/AcrR family transcriptional regulator n=1 Tax=Flavobacterium sp. J372 TaxID=2898436 RepID=UPI0027E2E76D|nr:helix-turn-helix domain-containing protein [Flavobacterium sp. J372]
MREIILKKANEMFLTLGFKSVTMDDIAAELGISKRQFTSTLQIKQNLLKPAP